MFESIPDTYRLARCVAFFVCSALVFAVSSCTVKQKVAVWPLLSPRATASTPELIAEVNRLAQVKSIRGKVYLEFEDNSFAENGIAEKYKRADGTVVVQRPGQISLKIQIPFVGTSIAEMTSNGDQFRVAVLQGDQKYRKFVSGTNNKTYAKLPADGNGGTDGHKEPVMTEQRAVSVFSNLRPQHFTSSLLLDPIKPATETGFIYSQTEVFEDEVDDRQGAKKGNRVVRGYYVLDELKADSSGAAKVTRRFWFDRTGGIRLARLQTFEADGTLETDVSFGAQQAFGETGQAKLPVRITLTRPREHYKLSLTYQTPETVKLDQEYPASAFVLENKWGLPEVNLDEPKQ
jgi:hypothetical protein